MTETLPPRGGTEILVSQLSSAFAQTNVHEHVNLIVSNTDPSLIDPNRKNVLWQHLNYDQEAAQNMNSAEYLDKIDAVVFVSHWQYDMFRRIHQVPAYKSVVIPNATKAVTYQPRNNSVKKLVYTSTPWRGLQTLLDSLDLLRRDDYHLDVYSSTSIYGSGFFESEDHKYHQLWDRCITNPRVTLHGYQDHSTVLSAVAQADILAYPNIWEETFCLSALEALMAGCRVVTTNLGALPEVCGPWARMIPYGANHDVLANRFAHLLNQELDRCPHDNQFQSTFYNNHYTWAQIIPKWAQLFEQVIGQS